MLGIQVLELALILQGLAIIDLPRAEGTFWEHNSEKGSLFGHKGHKSVKGKGTEAVKTVEGSKQHVSVNLFGWESQKGPSGWSPVAGGPHISNYYYQGYAKAQNGRSDPTGATKIKGYNSGWGQASDIYRGWAQFRPTYSNGWNTHYNQGWGTGQNYGWNNHDQAFYPGWGQNFQGYNNGWGPNIKIESYGWEQEPKGEKLKKKQKPKTTTTEAPPPPEEPEEAEEEAEEETEMGEEQPKKNDKVHGYNNYGYGANNFADGGHAKSNYDFSKGGWNSGSYLFPAQISDNFYTNSYDGDKSYGKKSSNSKKANSSSNVTKSKQKGKGKKKYSDY